MDAVLAPLFAFACGICFGVNYYFYRRPNPPAWTGNETITTVIAIAITAFFGFALSATSSAYDGEARYEAFNLPVVPVLLFAIGAAVFLAVFLIVRTRALGGRTEPAPRTYVGPAGPGKAANRKTEPHASKAA